MDTPEVLVRVLGVGAVKLAAVQTADGPRVRVTILGEDGADKAAIDLQELAAQQVAAGLEATAQGMRLGTELAQSDLLDET